MDVLTLSATPIPRTLNMALAGIRDMSTIEEPPQDRLPVQTFVMEHDWGVLADAMRRELNRGGQVYYLHNRVDNIERTAMRIAEMLDGASVAVAHGKMDEEQLSRVMEDMVEGRVQVLVCTTIIETGIDIPNVNTLIIEDADKLGLAQLHQIRGRVGRSTRRASAYLTFKRDKSLTEIAEKRLEAIREFAEFNSGFRIAMRDLEIRGAGNLLGAEQSGHLIDVGYDMYLKLLEEAVLEEKGEKPVNRASSTADLAISANIPESYVASSEQRMDLYRRIALIRTEVGRRRRARRAHRPLRRAARRRDGAGPRGAAARRGRARRDNRHLPEGRHAALHPRAVRHGPGLGALRPARIQGPHPRRGRLRAQDIAQTPAQGQGARRGLPLCRSLGLDG